MDPADPKEFPDRKALKAPKGVSGRLDPKEFLDRKEWPEVSVPSAQSGPKAFRGSRGPQTIHLQLHPIGQPLLQLPWAGPSIDSLVQWLRFKEGR